MALSEHASTLCARRVRAGEGAGGQLRRLEAACAAAGREVPPATRALLAAKDAAQRARKGVRGKGNGHDTAGPVTADTKVTWHTCKDPKGKCKKACFRVKASTTVPKHESKDGYCGTCEGGKNCKGCGDPPAANDAEPSVFPSN